MTDATEGRDPLDPPDRNEEDPLIDVLMRLARADFDARAPRTFDGGRRDTLAYLINTVSEELARVVQGLRQHEETLDLSVQSLSEVLSSHAAGDFSARAPRAEDGSPLDVLAFIINNTGAETGRLFEERNRAFDELQQAKETEAVSRAKSAFLANVSHELRTPLTLILGPLNTVLRSERERLSPSSVEDLETVLRNAGRLSRMVNDLLDFTRAEEGKTQPSWQWTDAAGVVEDAIRDLQPIARARKLRLESEIVGARREVALDQRMFEKVVVNLVGNALKFTPAAGEVRAVLEFAADQLVLRVSDTGIGISAAQCERVFDRFHQVDTSQTRQFEGSGLGLALVREFATAMGGSASVHSTVGEGSTFSVIVPMDAAGDSRVLPADADATHQGRFAELAMLSEPREVSLREVPETSPDPAGSPRPFVLVAEDNADMRRYICRVLAPHFEVRAVTDGVEALEALRGRVPDVVLSDVMMPNLDGLELVRRVKADPQLAVVPIVLLTARAGSNLSVEGLDVGADDYLAKPFAPQELVARVRAAARLRATGKRLAQTLDELQVTKSLVLRMGQVDAASSVLSLAGERLHAALARDDHQALRELAGELQRFGAPSSGFTGEFVDVAALAGSLLGGAHEGAGDSFPVEGPWQDACDALERVLDGLAIPRDGSAQLRVVKTDDGVVVEVEATASAEPARQLSGPLPTRLDLDDLAFARAHLALLQRGVDSQLSTRDGRITLRLAPG